MNWPGRGTRSAPGRQLDRQAQEQVRLGAINRSTLTEWMGVCSDSQTVRPSRARGLRLWRHTSNLTA